MAQTGNKVAQRYRQMIVDAFLSLCHTYDYNEITILMIAQEADISRQTFYRHFKTKDDIIYYCLDTLSHRGLYQIKYEWYHRNYAETPDELVELLAPFIQPKDYPILA